ncbi:MAG: hypothetical protein VX519_09460 [Myxococcota bacterium]|nr:hypothetical protein [Myxococcota bacterium]
MLGSSIAPTAVDINELEERLGKQVGLVWKNGAGSAWWYLVLKNRVLSSATPPKQVVLIFRDHLLTTPSHRTTGPWRQSLDEHTTEQEPELWERAYSHQPGDAPGVKLERMLQKTLTPWLNTIRPTNRANRAEIQERTRQGIKKAVARLTGHPEVDQWEAAVFPAERMDAVTLEQDISTRDGKSGGWLNFEDALPTSFLPLIVEEVKQAGSELVLVRHKRQRDLHPGHQTKELKQYTRSLRSWLENQGVRLVDFSERTELMPEHYTSADHLGTSGQEVFTRLLSQELAAPRARPETDLP